MSDPLRLSWIFELLSGVVIERPKVLGFRFGANVGIINDGEGGAEEAWLWLCEVLDVSEEARRGKEELVDVLLAPRVLTDRFFVFRGFLFGESDRLNPGRLGDELVGKPARYILSSPNLGAPSFDELRDVTGSRLFGDSGDELGDGSVRVESTVDIVVVGEDSVDSDGSVAIESRRCTLELVHRGWL